MPYLEIALKSGNTILVEDERSAEAFSQDLSRKGEIAASRIELFDTDQKYDITLTEEDVAAVATAVDLEKPNG